MSSSGGRSSSRASLSGSSLPAEAILAGRASLSRQSRIPAESSGSRSTSTSPPPAPTAAAPAAPRPRSFTGAHAAEFERAYGRRQSQFGTSPPPVPRTYTPTSELVRAGSIGTGAGAASAYDPTRPLSSLGLLSAHHLPAAHHGLVPAGDTKPAAPMVAPPHRHSMRESSYYARSVPKAAVMDEKAASASLLDHDGFERLIQQADDYESARSILGMRFGTNDLVRASFPCVGPFLASFYADDIAEAAAKLGVAEAVSERLHDDARCLCCLSSLFCWFGVCAGGCIKRRNSPGDILRTYRSVAQNPKLYVPTVAEAGAELRPHEAAEREVLRKYETACTCC